MSKLSKDEAVRLFAGEAHESWRRIIDPAYGRTGVVTVSLARQGVELNVPFDALPPIWQTSNLDSGITAWDASEIVMRRIGAGSPRNALQVGIEEAAKHIHEEWMKHNPITVQNADLHVRYEALPEVEKEKDRDRVRIMLRIRSGVPKDPRMASGVQAGRNRPEKAL